MPQRTRALVAVTLGAVTLSTAIAVASPATAAPASPVASLSTKSAEAAAQWIRGQVSAALVTDPGVGLDMYFALQSMGVGPDEQSSLLAAATAGAAEVTQPASAAKLATGVELAGQDASDVGGTDLIARVENATNDTTGATPAAGGGVGQAWVTRALALAGSPEAAASVAFLLTNQCEDGGFRQIYGASCTSYGDATAFAARSLLDAKAARVGDADTIDRALAAAAANLVASQAKDGSFSNDSVPPAPNTNTTGLAAVALADLGRAAQATAAARWVAAQQATPAVATGTPLAADIGAIAFTPAALQRDRVNGLAYTRDQWQRASAQAAPALTLLTTAGPRVGLLPGFVPAGGVVRLAVSGAEPGWTVTGTVSGGGRFCANANAAGAASVAVRFPAGTARRSVTVTDARGVVVGSAGSMALAGRGFWVRTAKSKVKRSKYQAVRASGLAAREPVRVYYRGRLVKRGTASATGTYYYKFKVGKKKGRATVSVYGAFNNRRGSKTFKVVK